MQQWQDFYKQLCNMQKCPCAFRWPSDVLVSNKFKLSDSKKKKKKQQKVSSMQIEVRVDVLRPPHR